MGFELVKIRIIWKVLVLIRTRRQVFHQNETLIPFVSVTASNLRFCNRLVE